MSVARWVEAQVPPVPEGFRRRLVDSLTDAPSDGSDLARETLAALARSASGEAERGGAFELLVADALATWAAQAVLDFDDAERRLEELVGTFAG